MTLGAAVQFVNLTPFPALAIRGIDTQDREFHVFVMRTVYQLVPHPNGPGAQHDWFEAVLLDDDPPPLVMEDLYAGAVGASSVRAESDLAPFKPRCDVLVTGHAHAPLGRPARRWNVGLRISVPEPHPGASLPPAPPPLLASTSGPSFHERVAWQQRQQIYQGQRSHALNAAGEQSLRTLINKHLSVHGPRQLQRRAMGAWQMLDPEPAATVPLAWERAYGGASVVPDPRHGQDGSAQEHLLNEVCFLNPLGTGWQHSHHVSALRKSGARPPALLRAPQVEYPSDPVKALDETDQPAGASVQQMLDISRRYAHRPAGFGPLGRAWTPRIQAAGRYDTRWLQQRWPGLPKDFDMAYWNCAPADQQIEFPRSDLVIELGRLVDPAICRSGHAIAQLPGHRAALLLKLRGGLLMSAAPVIDTVHIDTDVMQVAVVWRAAVSVEMNVEVAEARYELDPLAPLIPFASPGWTWELQRGTAARTPGFARPAHG